jgi:hypothetical protein
VTFLLESRHGGNDVIFIYFSGKQAFIEKIDPFAEVLYKKQCNREIKELSAADQIELITCDKPAVTSKRKEAFCVNIMLDCNEPREKGVELERIIKDYFQPLPGQGKLSNNAELKIMIFRSA